MGLTRLAIARSIFIWMVMALIALFGVIAYQSMRVELNPDVSFGVVTVTTVYPGAGPEEVNTLVTRVIEDGISGVANLRELTSVSQEGVSSVVANFEIGSDQEAALNEVRARIDRVLNDLPREAEKPVVQKFDTASDPVLTMSLRSERLSDRQLRDLAENRLKDVFSRIPGVANVGVAGGELREIQIRLRRDAMDVYRIGISDVQRAVQAASVNVPGGRVVTGDGEYAVRLLGEWKTVEQVADTWLTFQDRNRGDGPIKSVRLGDIATVVDSNAERRTSSRLDGADSVTLVVQKTREGNAVQISRLMREGEPSLLKSLEDQYGIEFVVTLDSSTQIRESLFDLQFAIGFGIFLVMAVIWLFLHNLRGTFIVALSIPICIFTTFIALWAFGFTINNLSMLAVSLAIGVMVDDSIVVIENIYRHLTMGEEPVEAAINGRSEIGLAAIAITLADVVVFIPIAFMGGVVGQFFRPLGIGYAVAVLASLFVSFTVTPMLASKWYRKGEDWEHPKGRFARWFEDTWHRFSLVYRSVLAWSLDHRWFVFTAGFVTLMALFIFIGGSFAPSLVGAAAGQIPMILFCTVVGALVFIVNLFRRIVKPQFVLYGALFGLVFPIAAGIGFLYRDWKGEDVFKFAFFPPSDSGQVSILIDLPPNASLAATERVVERIESIVAKHPEAHYVNSSLGTRGSGFAASQQGSNYAAITVTLYEKAAFLDSLPWSQHEEKLRFISDTRVAAEMLEMVDKVPGARVTVSAGSNFGFGAAIQLSFRSDDREALTKTSQAVFRGLEDGAVDGVITPDLSSKPGKPELRAIPNRPRLADADLTVAEVGGALRVMYEGDTTTKFRVGGDEYDVRVMLDRLDRDDPRLLGEVPVAYRQNQPIYLAEVTTIEEGQALNKIDRRSRQEEIIVTAELLPGFAAGSVQSRIDEWLQAEGLVPESVRYQPLGQADVQAQETGYLLGALGLGFLLVYMVLASLYNNLLYPLIIQLSQPQAMVGAILALVLTDKTLNIVGFIGIIALVGLVGKNAILLVDFTNTLRERGFDRRTALLDSGQTRLRPIMMTTLALVFGLLPVALAIGRGSEFRETIGIIIIGGTILSTVLTLLIIPCSYTIFDDIAESFARLFRRGSDTPAR